MKRINILYAVIPLLMTSISTYAVVTADGTTAYRLAAQSRFVVFTDDPNDDPLSAYAPLGAAFMEGITCTTSAGNAFIRGLSCSGTSGDPIETYLCGELTFVSNASNTTWCLFSENPRIGDKAWAVKYVDGLIPTNNGASIVRCQGTDKFDSVNGCTPGPSEISIEGGYINLETTDGSAPVAGDCTLDAHNGRMAVDDVNLLLYICTATGWKTFLSTP